VSGHDGRGAVLDSWRPSSIDENPKERTWSMNQQDLNELTKAAQDHAYSLGLKRGLAAKELTDAKILEISEPFGEFRFGDAQGHKRIDFARAILANAK
jgi:hypothetical protein